MIIVRKATKNDLTELKKVYYQTWTEAYHDVVTDKYLHSHNLEQYMVLSEECYENTYVAIVKDRIVGYASFCQAYDEKFGKSGEIKAIGILKEYQGLGIGRMLMNHCFIDLYDFKNIVTWTSANNVNSIEFYHHFGFVEDGNKMDLQIEKGKRLPLLRMRRKIHTYATSRY